VVLPRSRRCWRNHARHPGPPRSLSRPCCVGIPLILTSRFGNRPDGLTKDTAPEPSACRILTVAFPGLCFARNLATRNAQALEIYPYGTQRERINDPATWPIPTGPVLPVAAKGSQGDVARTPPTEENEEALATLVRACDLRRDRSGIR